MVRPFSFFSHISLRSGIYVCSVASWLLFWTKWPHARTVWLP
uniref:Uncharacterized protein n=1 Tax=Arundo donax TaxID=35708 RepID=A0A0A9CD37_ARUDO